MRRIYDAALHGAITYLSLRMRVTTTMTTRMTTVMRNTQNWTRRRT